MALITRAEFWEAEKPRVERELQGYDLQKFSEPKKRTIPGDPSHKAWDLRTRGDEIVDINRDAVSHLPTLFPIGFLLHSQVHPQLVQVCYILTPLG